MTLKPLFSGNETFSEVTGGPRRTRPSRRPPSFSRLISGGNRRSPAPSSGGNAEGVSPPAIASRSGEAGGTPPQISRRKDQAGSLGTEVKASLLYCLMISYLKILQFFRREHARYGEEVMFIMKRTLSLLSYGIISF